MHYSGVDQLQAADIRRNQYGIRTKVFVEGKPIKFEIVLEGRIQLACSPSLIEA
jgi:hypothetical protein